VRDATSYRAAIWKITNFRQAVYNGVLAMLEDLANTVLAPVSA
jgi:hypothetical protein